MLDGLTIDTMRVQDLEQVLAWAADEGWNPGLDDARPFHAADPQGFFIARLADQPIAAVSVVNHDRANAFVGLYICRPEWRGKGAGLAIFTHGLLHAGARSIGLDGVPAEEHNYASIGFVQVGQSLRFEGRLPAQESATIRPAVQSDMPALIALDARAGGFARPQFLEAWLAPAPSLRETVVVIEGGDIRGFATWRACREGTKIGPVIANSTRQALDLVAHIAALRRQGPLVIDLPSTNADFRRELEASGFTNPFATVRMYRGAVPRTSDALQAIASMELG